MLPEFSIQAVKLQANTRQPKPIKVKFKSKLVCSPETKEPIIKKKQYIVNVIQGSQQKSVPKAKTSVDKLSHKGSDDLIETQQLPPIEPPQPQKVNMDERYLYYEHEAKKNENLVTLCDGVQFYKPIKPEDMPKPPKPKKKTSKVDTNIKPSSRTEKSEKQSVQSVSSDLQHSLHQSKSLNQTSRDNQQSASTLMDENGIPHHSIPVDPNFLVQGEVDGYQIDDSQSQIFGFGLTDYIKNNNHRKDLGDKDVAEEVKPQSEQVYSYYDYYPTNPNGQIPKPLLESVNYMNYLKEQQALQEQQDEEQNK